MSFFQKVYRDSLPGPAPRPAGTTLVPEVVSAPAEPAPVAPATLMDSTPAESVSALGPLDATVPDTAPDDPEAGARANRPQPTEPFPAAPSPAPPALTDRAESSPPLAAIDSPLALENQPAGELSHPIPNQADSSPLAAESRSSLVPAPEDPNPPPSPGSFSTANQEPSGPARPGRSRVAAERAAEHTKLDPPPLPGKHHAVSPAPSRVLPNPEAGPASPGLRAEAGTPAEPPGGAEVLADPEPALMPPAGAKPPPPEAVPAPFPPAVSRDETRPAIPLPGPDPMGSTLPTAKRDNRLSSRAAMPPTIRIGQIDIVIQSGPKPSPAPARPAAGKQAWFLRSL